jgi:hypothetical protein
VTSTTCKEVPSIELTDEELAAVSAGTPPAPSKPFKDMTAGDFITGESLKNDLISIEQGFS